MTGAWSAVAPSVARGGWNTDLVAAGERRGGAGRSLAPARWVLLLAVLAGLFGMHVLTAESSSGGHGALPTAAGAGEHSASHSGGHDSATDHADPALTGSLPEPAEMAMGTTWAAGAAAAEAPDPGGMPEGHGGLSGCILFMVIGGALVLLVLLSARAWPAAFAAWSATWTAWGQVRRRGPPGRDRPRVALCVIRV